MYCGKCGKSYEGSVNYCCFCGAPTTVSPLAQKKLTRSRQNRKIAGVCGGFAEYFDMDPTVMRLLWVITAVFIGWGVIGYLVAWIEVVPVGQSAPLTQT